MFVKRASRLTIECVERLKFPTSQMGRDLLLLKLSDASGNRIIVATAHLESLVQNKEERQSQFKTSLTKIMERAEAPGVGLCVLVGDLNMSSKDEAASAETAKGWQDALPKLATWDARSNRRVRLLIPGIKAHCRFDRCYFRTTSGDGRLPSDWKFGGGSLFGTREFDTLEHGFVSDHYGLRLRWRHPSGFGRAKSPVVSGAGAGGGAALGGYVLGGAVRSEDDTGKGEEEGEEGLKERHSQRDSQQVEIDIGGCSAHLFNLMIRIQSNQIQSAPTMYIISAASVSSLAGRVADACLQQGEASLQRRRCMAAAAAAAAELRMSRGPAHALGTIRAEVPPLSPMLMSAQVARYRTVGGIR